MSDDTNATGTPSASPGRAILDLGANAGDFAIELAVRNPAHRVIAVEPIRALADGIEARARGEGLGNVEVVAVAVDRTEGPGVINVAQHGDQGVSSLLDLDESGVAGDEYWRSRPDLRYDGTEAIDRITLQTLIERHGIDEVDFIKLDVQGLDLVALESAGAALSRIRAGMLEVPTTSRQRLYAEEEQDLPRAYAVLDRLGFEVYAVKPNDPACNEVNVFFIRRGEDPAAVERELSLRGVHLYDGKHYWAVPCSSVEELKAAEGLPGENPHLRRRAEELVAEVHQGKTALSAEIRARRELAASVTALTEEVSLGRTRESVLRRELTRAQVVAAQQAEIAQELLASTSWRVTRPLRGVRPLVHRIRSRG